MNTAAVSGRLRRITSSHAFAWLYCLWILAVTVRFSLKALETARHFFLSVSEVQWFAGWMLVVVVLLAACAFLRPAIVTAAWFALLLTAAGAMLWMGHLLLTFALAMSMLLGAACVGRLIIRPLLGGAAGDPLLFLCGLPVGLTLFALITLGAGLLGLLTALTCWIVFAAGIAAAAAYGRENASSFRNAGRWLCKNLQKCSRETALLLAVMGTFSLLSLVWAMAPEIGFDALNYHLAVPRLYLEHRRVVELPFLHAYFVRNLEMLFTWMMALGGPETVKLAVFGLSLASGMATFALGSLVFGRRAGLWAAALFHTMPLAGWESGTVYIDNIVALFVTCALAAILLWLETRRPRVLIAAAMLAGAAVGSKLNATYAFFAAAPLMVWGTIADCRRQVPEIIRHLFYALSAFSIAALPCYALFWWYTGNPAFPLLNGLFQSPRWVFDNTLAGWASFGLPRTLSSLVRFPFRLTLETGRFAELAPNGALGISILAAFPFAGLMLAGSRKAARLLVVSALVYLLLLFYTMQYARFILPILPVAAVLGAGLASQLTASGAAAIVRMCLFIAIVLQFPALAGTHSAFPDVFPFAVATGQEDREHFLERALPGYSAAMYLNRVAEPTDGVLAAGTENLRFYTKPQLQSAALTVLGDPLRATLAPMPGMDVYRIIRNAGVSWLFVSRGELERPPVWFPYLQPEFLARYTVLEFTDGAANVYRLVER